MDSLNVGNVTTIEESSSDSEGNYDPNDDSGDSDLSQELFQTNTGVLYTYQGQNDRLMNERRAQESIDFRNKYFTPDVIRHILIVKPTTNSSWGEVDLEGGSFGIDTKRVIGFKVMRARLQKQNISDYIQIVIPDIPYIACKKNSGCVNIVDTVSTVTSATNTIYYENKSQLHENHFSPIKLSKFTVNLRSYDTHTQQYENDSTDYDPTSYIEFQITLLNRQE